MIPSPRPRHGLELIPKVDSLGTKKEFTSDQEVRWCPGCGDYAILSTVQSFLPTLGVPRENIVVISGIGCAARLPYYVDTFGIHSIHGRAPAIATGLAVTRPDLSVWVVGGDGDLLSIGGNHLLHALRRNVNIKLLLLNNRIYGLTKGQYSPTSEQGKHTKSSPAGSADRPVNPISLALGCEATFVARTIDSDRKHQTAILQAAAEHRGAAFVEILQNCDIYNDGAFAAVKDPATRDSATVRLRDGEPLVFGENDSIGLRRMPSGEFEVVDVATVGMASISVHDATAAGPELAFALSRLGGLNPGPTPIGIFRAVPTMSYDDEVRAQIEAAQAKPGAGELAGLLSSGETWSVD